MLRLPPSIITSRARKLALPPGGRGELSTLGGQSRAIPPVQLVSTPPNTSLAARSCLLGRYSGRLPGISHQVSPKPPEGDLYASARCLTRRFLRLGHETTPGPTPTAPSTALPRGARCCERLPTCSGTPSSSPSRPRPSAPDRARPPPGNPPGSGSLPRARGTAQLMCNAPVPGEGAAARRPPAAHGAAG